MPVKALSTLGLLALGLCLIFFFSLSEAHGEAPPASLADIRIPQYTLAAAPETHLPVRVKPRKSQVVHLDFDVGHVTIGEGRENVAAVPYTKTSVALVPAKAGVAHMTVFDKNGKARMSRYIVVSEPAEKYVRILQTCRKGQGDATCASPAPSTYYCPNLCYKTRLVGNGK